MLVVVLLDALIEEETSLDCVSIEFRPIKKTHRGGDCGFVPLNITLPLSLGRANNGSRPNIHVFAVNTSSKVSSSKVKLKYIQVYSLSYF